MDIRLATSDTEIAACFPVMRELRPELVEEMFVSRIRNLEAAGYRLASLQGTEGAVAVAGFRISENLAWGRFLYVDDLVTLSTQRSQGHGHRLLSWLRDYASQQGCAQLHLDSGMQRKDAHRFYEREGMPVTGLHFAEHTAHDQPKQRKGSE